MRKIHPFFMIFILAALSCLITWHGSTDVYAAEDSNGNGIAADVLSISVGYAGLEATVRKTYTAADLKALGEVQAKYTWIDRMPAPCYNLAKGAKLLDILKDSGIDEASVSRIHFTCSDAHETEELTSPYLFDQLKYYYPALFELWDYDAQIAGIGADEGQIPVDTIIAYEDVWQRITSPEDELKTWDDMTSGSSFRLIFGMTDTQKQTAFNSAKWIHSIEVTLAGAPPEEEDKKDEEKDDQKDEIVGSENGDMPGDEDDAKGRDKAKDKIKDKAKSKTKDDTKEDKPVADKSTAKKTQELTDDESAPGATEEVKEEGIRLTEIGVSGESSADAGYQPWRVRELSEGAVAMNAPADPGEGMGGPAAGAMGGFLVIGGTWQFMRLKRSMTK
ncbi:MAG: hypothetical protein LBN35_01770 [Clostridiales Family XIII bacterium]|jgi:hypothetical protein|nr:hypothetical protein [Clostridiales Family XIII bacterium]